MSNGICESPTAAVMVCSLIMLVFTMAFTFAHKLFRKSILSSYLKCFAAGIILGTLIFDIVKDLYIDIENPKIGAFLSGASFLLLFWIDKSYLCSNDHDAIPKDISTKKAAIFVLALSVHSFLEGLGFASKARCTKSMVTYSLGLFGHKWMEAFALGVSVSDAPFRKSTANGLLIFYSILTPLGMVLGNLILEHMFKNLQYGLVASILTGVSIGSFFYIGFVEMLNSEFETEKNSKMKTRYKLTSLLIGFTLMGIIFSLID